MRYYIQRGAQQYGPYSIIDLQRYVAAGNIAPGEMGRREDAGEWVPVSQILAGTSPPPPPPGPMPPQSQWSSPPAGQAWGAPQPAPGAGPMPPDLHWAIVLLVSIVTCGIFKLVWLFIEAAFVKKIDQASNTTLLLVSALVCEAGAIVAAVAGHPEPDSITAASVLLGLATAVLMLVAIYGMRSSMLHYYNQTEPFGLEMNPVVTFFFGVYQIQHHFSRIATWKRTGMRT